MKIALVAHHARPGGGQDRYLLELARHLAPRHDVHLVVVRAEGVDGMGVTVHEVGLSDLPMLALQPRFASRVTGVIRGQRFDIVHAIGGSFPGANVITAQYCQSAWRDARARYRVHEDSILQDLYRGIVTRQGIAFERRAYSAPQLRGVIAVSRTTAAEVTRYYGVGAERIRVVHNGVDPATFDRARYPAARDQLRRALGVAAETPLALLVGTYARKGLDTAIAAVARASQAMHLVVAGAGNDALARRWAAASGLAGRLHLLGPRPDVAELFAAADVFVLPTRYEPFGMVIVEAMASELPVVVSASAGAAELIVPGTNGFVVDRPDDADGFAGGINAAMAEPRGHLGRAARAAALTVSWDQVAARTEQAYAAALA